MEIIKSREGKLKESTLKSLLGKYIYVPVNHLSVNEDTVENVWFCGQMAGYEKATLKYDYGKLKFLKKSNIYYNVLLTDGKGYALSKTRLEIQELTEEEFKDIVVEQLGVEVADQLSFVELNSGREIG